jgi:birA, biotin-[acetyl-CoA-carboxylase] ligase region
MKTFLTARIIRGLSRELVIVRSIAKRSGGKIFIFMNARNNFNIVELEEAGSTNAEAKRLAGDGAGAWTAVTAKKQTGGYGRKGDSWASPEGGLYFSVILPKNNLADLQILTILAAFCVANAVKENFFVEPMIKLPNDVYLNGKKLAGILTENVVCGGVKSSVIGIGVNTNIENFGGGLEKIATSVKIETNGEVDNRALLEQIINQLHNIFREISQ